MRNDNNIKQLKLVNTSQFRGGSYGSSIPVKPAWITKFKQQGCKSVKCAANDIELPKTEGK